jgi:hypothetical protein
VTQRLQHGRDNAQVHLRQRLDEAENEIESAQLAKVIDVGQV